MVLPLRDIDEVRSWAMQRLGNPHCQSHVGGKLRSVQASELARRAVQTIGRFLPGGTLRRAGGVERAVEFL